MSDPPSTFPSDKGMERWAMRAIGALRQQGRQIDEGLLKHVAPVHWNHINLTGDYSWRQNKRVEKGGFRPLRIPPQS
jgi:hypothetical protein